MASIERARTQRGGWVVRYRGPDRRARSKSFRRKVDAERFARSVETDVLRGTWVDPAGGRVTLDEWAERWWSTTVNLRPTTRARDEATWRNHIAPVFGPLPLAAIDHLAVREWVSALSASGKAPATVHKAHQVLAKILRSAVDAGLLASAPTDRVPLPKIEREEMRFLTPAEIARLADAIDGRFRSFVLVGAYAGLRAGEMFGLRRSRVDLLRGRVDVAEIAVEVGGRFFFGPPKTRAGRRSVPLPRFVVDELTEHLGSRGVDELVFPAPAGGPVRASLFRRRFWQPACIAAGLGEMARDDETKKPRYEGLRIHDLRHTAVALWIAAGASPKEIAARAGHTSVSVVLDRYGHLLPHTEEQVTNALDLLGRSAAGRAEGLVLDLAREERARTAS